MRNALAVHIQFNSSRGAFLFAPPRTLRLYCADCVISTTLGMKEPLLQHEYIRTHTHTHARTYVRAI